MKVKSFFIEIWLRVCRMKTIVLVNILLSIAFLCLLLAAVFYANTNTLLPDVLLAFGLFIGGLAGLPIIIRGEVNFTLLQFEGPLAVIIGLLFSISGFWGSTMLFIGILKSLTSK